MSQPGVAQYFKPKSYADSMADPQDVEFIDWDAPVKNLRETTIGKLINLITRSNIALIKDQEAAFFVKSQYPFIYNDTPCEIGACRSGRVLRVGKYEYRVYGRKVSRKLMEQEK